MIYHRNVPGVSIMFMCNSSGAGTQAAENLLRNEEPKVESPLNGKSLTPVSAFPLIVCASSPYTTAMNRSVCVCVCVRGGVELDPQAATERSTSPLQYFHRTQLNAFSVHINSVCNSVSCAIHCIVHTSSWLGPNVNLRIIAADQVSNEGGLTGGVLTCGCRGEGGC